MLNVKSQRAVRNLGVVPAEWSAQAGARGRTRKKRKKAEKDSRTKNTAAVPASADRNWTDALTRGD
jgi:hypothetical protein